MAQEGAGTYSGLQIRSDISGVLGAWRINAYDQGDRGWEELRVRQETLPLLS